jgi:hypothetical protein
LVVRKLSEALGGFCFQFCGDRKWGKMLGARSFVRGDVVVER